MIKELEEDREESQDPEVEFAIAGAVREYGGLEIILSMIQVRCILAISEFFFFICIKFVPLGAITEEAFKKHRL